MFECSTQRGSVTYTKKVIVPKFSPSELPTTIIGKINKSNVWDGKKKKKNLCNCFWLKKKHFLEMHCCVKCKAMGLHGVKYLVFLPCRVKALVQIQAAFLFGVCMCGVFTSFLVSSHSPKTSLVC